MALLVWEEALSVGDAHIDDEHKHLFSLMDQLYEAMRNSQPREVVGALLDELVRQTEQHFAEEEVFMKKIGYADFAEHKTEHERLLRDVYEVQSRFHAGAISITVSVSNYLAAWLKDHIKTQDQKLMIALKQG
jgi:hemerythrin